MHSVEEMIRETEKVKLFLLSKVIRNCRFFWILSRDINLYPSLESAKRKCLGAYAEYAKAKQGKLFLQIFPQRQEKQEKPLEKLKGMLWVAIFTFARLSISGV